MKRVLFFILLFSFVFLNFSCSSSSTGEGGEDADIIETEVSSEVSEDQAEQVTPDTHVEEEVDVTPEDTEVTPDSEEVDVGSDTEVIPEDVDAKEVEVEEKCTSDDDCKGKCGSLDLCDECVCSDEGECVKQVKKGCCMNNEDCDDSDPCTIDNCPEPGGQCTYSPDPTCCSTDTVFLKEDFSSGTMGLFTLTDDNDPDDKVTWQVTDYKFHSKPYALYFGDPDCHTYYNGALDEGCNPVDPVEGDASEVAGEITSNEIVISSPCVLSLEFWANYEGHDCSGTSEDLIEYVCDNLEVIVTEGNESYTMFYSAKYDPKDSTNGEWKLYAVDLTQFNPTQKDDSGNWIPNTITITFRFDTHDGFDNYHEGVYLDDIYFHTTPGTSICTKDSDCESDDNVCTTDKCLIFANNEEGKGVCDYIKIEGCCTKDEDCLPLTCENAKCENQKCVFTPVDSEECCNEINEVVSSWTFEDGMEGWEVTESSAGGQITWQVDDKEASEGTYSLYFGNKETHSYDNAGEKVVATVESPLIVLPNKPGYVLLNFDLWLSTEFDLVAGEPFENELGIDRLSVKVLVGDGDGVEVWNSDAVKGTTLNPETGEHEFKNIIVPISDYKGNAIRIAFTFDSYEESQNDFEGAYIDNINIQYYCNEPCTNDESCDDGLSCTVDKCESGKCTHVSIGTCCESDEDCDDGNDCTTDSCVQNLCSHSFTTDSTCCDSDPLINVFEQGFEDDSFMENATVITVPEDSKVTWSIVDTNPASGSKALYFGNPETMTYENYDETNTPIKSFASIEFPEVQMPYGGAPYVEFKLYLETEFDGDPELWVIPDDPIDKLTLYANDIEIWNSFVYEIAGSTCNGGVCNYVTVKAKLEDFLGQKVKFKFTFDTFDDAGNNYKGAFIDDFKVVWNCESYACLNSLECYTDDPCYTDKCVDNVCEQTPTNAPNCCYPQNILTENFENGETSMSFSNSDTDKVKWQVVDSTEGKVKEGSYSLYYGDPETKTYNDPDKDFVYGEAWLDVDVPDSSKLSLKFWVYIDVEDTDPQPDFIDVFKVYVVDNANPDADPVVIFTNKDGSNQSYAYYKKWNQVTVDFSQFAKKNVSIYFSFNSGDNQNNSGEGVYVDDIELVSDCIE